MLLNPTLTKAAASLPRMAAARQRGVDVDARWRARPDVAALASALDGLSQNPPCNAVAFGARFAPWLSDADWLAALFDDAGRAMRADPFTAFPFRPAHGPVVDSIAILQAPLADVSLCWIDALNLAVAQEPTLVFSDTLSVVKVLRSGGLNVQSHCLNELPGAPLVMRQEPQRELADGDIIQLDNRRENWAMRSARSDAVLLKFSLRLPDPVPQRSFCATTGQPIATAMGDDGMSRMLPLLAVARLAGRAKRAAPVLAECARHPDPLLRWASIREWLVADTRAAMAALPAIASNDPDPQVRAVAAATLAALIPQRVDTPCPA